MLQRHKLEWEGQGLDPDGLPISWSCKVSLQPWNHQRLGQDWCCSVGQKLARLLPTPQGASAGVFICTQALCGVFFKESLGSCCGLKTSLQNSPVKM